MSSLNFDYRTQPTRPARSTGPKGTAPKAASEAESYSRPARVVVLALGGKRAAWLVRGGVG